MKPKQQPKQPMPSVAVLTVVYSPALGQVLAVQPQYPFAIERSAALEIFRKAEEFLITQSLLEQVAQRQAAPLGPKTNDEPRTG